MNWIKGILTAIIGTLLGMAGGQGRIGGKSTRRFALPALLTGYSLSVRFRWKYLALLALIIPLSVGYGVDSIFGALTCHYEPLTRCLYAIVLALPLIIFGLWRWLGSAILLIIAFQIQGGSLGKASWFGDFLIEDICRYSTLMILSIMNIIFDRD